MTKFHILAPILAIGLTMTACTPTDQNTKGSATEDDRGGTDGDRGNDGDRGEEDRGNDGDRG